MYTLSTEDMCVSHVFSVTEPSARSSTLLATHIRSMLTCSTGYQRPLPRSITRSCPFHPAFGHDQPDGTTHPGASEKGLLHQSCLDLANVG
jgi:hypothetical protein